MTPDAITSFLRAEGAGQRPHAGAERAGQRPHAGAERLAYLFSVTPRRPLFAGTHRWVRELPTGAPAARDELDAVVLLHMANLAVQACRADGSPARWCACATSAS